MSLVKSPVLTPEKLAACQANAQQSHGPATPEGVERIRAANTRHGYYSKAPGAEMRVLGEDPEEFEALLESLLEAWEPENQYQTTLVRRMARLTWRLERSDRIQEAMMVNQIEGLERNVARQRRREAASHDRVVTRLKNLMQAIDGNKFCSTQLDLDGLEEIYGKEPSGVGLEILTRVYKLLSPRVSQKACNPDQAKKDAEDEQLRFVTELLMKLKTRGKKSPVENSENFDISNDVIENKPTCKSASGISNDLTENKGLEN